MKQNLTFGLVWQVKTDKYEKKTEMACFVYTLLDLIYLVVYKQCNACQGTLHTWLRSHCTV